MIKDNSIIAAGVLNKYIKRCVWESSEGQMGVKARFLDTEL